jgi:methylenetetrahydrofolate--tRNA-(uracil-5-)-methyltransferase
MNPVTVVGAGLAGSEAAWQMAIRGIPVRLTEMKPKKMTPAHVSPWFAELVCSNSLRSDELTNAVGLLKEELRRLGSLIMLCADEHRVAAGGALAVDRVGFARAVTDRLRAHPLVEVVEEEVTDFPDGEVIIATGPLTSDAFADTILRRTGSEGMHFYDAVAPIVSLESVDMTSAFRASRYDKGTADYINCPMNAEEYEAFWRELISAREAEVHGFDDAGVFEGCMPVEVMARRGVDTLRFGPLKPVGLRDPRGGKEPYAVVQLRQDNAEGTLYNMVGFQTHLAFGEQKRVFSMIPALRNADFVRYGVMHRNTYLQSPGLLDRYYRLIGEERVAFAGQITGVEGYMESAGSGILAGINAARVLAGEEPFILPETTMLGAMSRYVADETVTDFQPMGAAMGLLPPLEERVRDKKLRYAMLAQRALADLENAINNEE